MLIFPSSGRTKPRACFSIITIKAFLELATGGTLASGLPLKAVTLSAESGTVSGH
jgi:hypothetical protein